MNFETDEINLPLYNLMLEVTRKCNLHCEHCMRGEPQNLDMSDEILEEVFRQIDHTYHLSLTGGEPFLAPHVLEKMVDIIIDRNIKVFRCTTVDNGTILNELGIRSIKALNRLGEYIYNSVWSEDTRNDPKEKLPISVSISNSQYHKNDIQKAIEFYKSYANEYVNVDDQGEWETGLKDKQGNVIKNKDIKGTGKWLKKEGRAKENNLPTAKYITDTYQVEFLISEDENKVAVKTGIQICANGNVVLLEPLSFETMDKKNMGNIMKEPLSAMIYKWNWNEPLTQREVKEYCDNMMFIENEKIPKDKRDAYMFKNYYLDTKKLLLQEGHREYPYMSKKDLNIAVTSKLALMMIEFARNVGIKVSDITDEEIIKQIVEYECEGELTENFTKEELENTMWYIIGQHDIKYLKEEGFIKYLKYKLDMFKKTYSDYYNKLEVSVYDK